MRSVSVPTGAFRVVTMDLFDPLFRFRFVYRTRTGHSAERQVEIALIAINYLDLVVEFIPMCAVILNREEKRAGNSRELLVAGSGHDLVVQVL